MAGTNHIPKMGCDGVFVNAPNPFAQEVGIVAQSISTVSDLFSSVMTARALTVCDLFELPADAFHSVIVDYPAVVNRLSQMALRSVPLGCRFRSCRV